jgi:peptide/nickel transport system substrate-binding protein
MMHDFIRRLRRGGAVAVLFLGTTAWAEPMHGIAMYGEPALPADFAHLPYVNPEAPKGGEIVSAVIGTYDSLNPYILKGSVPWQLSALVTETLMGRSLDEPFTLYPLLAESVETAPDRSWVEFALNPNARFSNGDPVTVEDVIWSYETLGTQGHPRYATFWTKVESIEPVGVRGVRITFNTPDRELAMLAGIRPILQKSQWEGVDFANADGLEMIPVTSGPYVVESFEPGRNVVLRRDPDYWGADLPFRRGTMNIDEVRIEFFGDETAAFEAFKTGDVTVWRETNPAKWATEYDFPLVQEGEVVLSEVPNQRPTGMTGLVMNARDPLFSDIRVRDAMIHAFNLRIHQRRPDRRRAAPY